MPFLPWLKRSENFVLKTVNCKLDNMVLGPTGVDGMTVLVLWVPRTSLCQFFSCVTPSAQALLGMEATKASVSQRHSCVVRSGFQGAGSAGGQTLESHHQARGKASRARPSVAKTALPAVRKQNSRCSSVLIDRPQRCNSLNGLLQNRIYQDSCCSKTQSVAALETASVKPCFMSPNSQQ